MINKVRRKKKRTSHGSREGVGGHGTQGVIGFGLQDARTGSFLALHISLQPVTLSFLGKSFFVQSQYSLFWTLSCNLGMPEYTKKEILCEHNLKIQKHLQKVEDKFDYLPSKCFLL